MNTHPSIRTLIVTLSIALTAGGFAAVSTDAEAARLGRGRPAGMQRQAPPAQPAVTPNTPAQPGVATNKAATPANQAAPAAAGAAAAAGKRSWMGPIAGIAAGLGLAALASHFGFGEGLANMMTMALLAIAVVFVVRWLMRRFAGAPAVRSGGLSYAGAGAPVNTSTTLRQPLPAQAGGVAQPAAPSGASASTQNTLDGFDTEAFERVAKMMFIRMQAANDASNIDDLRRFTTPELFASLRLDLQERGDVAQQTDVVQLDAKVVDTAQEPDNAVVTVRFNGLIREAAQDGAQPFDELWHLVKPTDGSREWAVAGITPTH